jgi:predicted transposase YbfD/YdcC
LKELLAMPDHPVLALHDAFADLADPRVDRTKAHLLLDIVAIAVCAVICGADSWVAIEEFGVTKQAWLQTFLALPNGIPSHDTFGRVFAALDAPQFQQSFLRWVRAVWPTGAGEVVAIDGKTLRGSHDRGIGKDAIHLVSAWASQSRLVLAQRKVDDKSNEITAIPEVLRLLDLAGCTVTLDAMGCQTAIAKQIVQQGAHYVLAVKENQEQLYTDIVDTFRYVEADGWHEVRHAHHQTVSGDHGRVEQRDYWLIQEADYLAYVNPKGSWTGLRAMGMVATERRDGSSVSQERRYYLIGGDLDARAFARAVRQHWGIENSVHWVLDVTFGEDSSRVRTGNAPQNFAVLRHIALNLLRHAPGKGSINTKRFRAALDDQYLLQVLES